jgi:alpha-L-arabinofuranosidase
LVGDTPLLDAAATLSENRDVLHLTLINRHPRRGVRIAWDLGAARPAGDARLGAVTGPEPWARNGFENPDTVRLDAETGSWESMSARVLPPASVSAVSLRLGGRLQ